MTNLEWIRTLSAKELSDLLYDYWLPRGQYVWTDSRKGLVKMLGETYLERDCDKCKHQGNCYCVKGLGCPFEPKTEPQNYCDDCLYADTCDSKEFFYACTSKATISKMEQVEESQTERYCTNCKHNGVIEDYECRTCNNMNHHEFIQSQTDCAWR